MDAGLEVDGTGHLEALTSPKFMRAASEPAMEYDALASIAAEETDLAEAALLELEEGFGLTSVQTAAEEASQSEIAETHAQATEAESDAQVSEAETDAQATEFESTADEDAAHQGNAAIPGPEGAQEEGLCEASLA